MHGLRRPPDEIQGFGRFPPRQRLLWLLRYALFSGKWS